MTFYVKNLLGKVEIFEFNHYEEYCQAYGKFIGLVNIINNSYDWMVWQKVLIFPSFHNPDYKPQFHIQGQVTGRPMTQKEFYNPVSIHLQAKYDKERFLHTEPEKI